MQVSTLLERVEVPLLLMRVPLTLPLLLNTELLPQVDQFLAY